MPPRNSCVAVNTVGHDGYVSTSWRTPQHGTVQPAPAAVKKLNGLDGTAEVHTMLSLSGMTT